MKSKNIFLVLFVLLATPLVSQTNDTIKFITHGVCGMCENRIEKALKVDGISYGDWDVDTHETTVIYNPKKFTPLQIQKLVAKVGHDTELVKADDDVYNSLHDCCKYRSEEVQNDHKQDAEPNKNKEIHVIEMSGKVYEKTASSKEPIFGANVYWLETTQGVTTNFEGEFILKRHSGENTLIISYVGLLADTVEITDEKKLEVVLSNNLALKEFTVVEKVNSTEISRFSAIKIERMNEKELQKAACCNLSESFETNPSVDVAYSDAITGTKQIQMLGLAGPNIQITNGNMPDIRGLSAIYGLTFIPGTWIKGIYLNKGTGSVINGFESIAGQMNVQLKEGNDSEKLNFNLYGNQSGRLEANLSLSKKLNKKWASILHLHASNRSFKTDVNSDGFMDNPLSENYILHNGWEYLAENGMDIKFGVDGIYRDIVGGQTNFNKGDAIDTLSPWGLNVNIKRAKFWAKIGKVFKNNPGKSMGLQLSGIYHDENSFYGLNNYSGKQNSYYANYIYQNIINNTDHSYSVGASFSYDNYLEKVNTQQYTREEIVPGVFAEYTLKAIQNFTLVAGLRGDYNNIYGAFATPRAHAKYDITENSSLRASVGRGQRTANIFTENSGVFATSRNIIVNGNGNPNYAYGLNPEVAWNYGLNFTTGFKLFNNEGTFTTDYYYTDFQNQIIVDWENPREVSFYNLNGKSISHSFQAQVDYELIKNLDVRVAYRFFDVKATYSDNKTYFKPLTANQRGFVNLAYETKNNWLFDATFNWIGEKRIPSTQANPTHLQTRTKSPSYVLLSGQITKKWNNRLDTYIGIENALNFKQKNPIIDSNNPYGDYFDSSLVWGPIFGRNIYAGLRYVIGKDVN